MCEKPVIAEIGGCGKPRYQARMAASVKSGLLLRTSRGPESVRYRTG